MASAPPVGRAGRPILVLHGAGPRLILVRPKPSVALRAALGIEALGPDRFWLRILAADTR